MPFVDIYCRVSTDEQERCAREYCDLHGLTVGMVHRETYSGAFYRERKKLEWCSDVYQPEKERQAEPGVG